MVAVEMGNRERGAAGRHVCVPARAAWSTTNRPPVGPHADARGFIPIDDYLQVPGLPNVFAAGDVATSITHPRPKAGVFAVRQVRGGGERQQRVGPVLITMGQVKSS